MTAGVSRDTTMGFSTLDGLPMETRPGPENFDECGDEGRSFDYIRPPDKSSLSLKTTAPTLDNKLCGSLVQ